MQVVTPPMTRTAQGGSSATFRGQFSRYCSGGPLHNRGILTRQAKNKWHLFFQSTQYVPEDIDGWASMSLPHPLKERYVPTCRR